MIELRFPRLNIDGAEGSRFDTVTVNAMWFSTPPGGLGW